MGEMMELGMLKIQKIVGTTTLRKGGEPALGEARTLGAFEGWGAQKVPSYHNCIARAS